MEDRGKINDGRQEVLVRLRKIEGQIRGIERMIEEERECREVIMQMSAVKAALSQAGVVVLTNYLANCLEGHIPADPENGPDLEDFKELLRKWY